MTFKNHRGRVAIALLALAGLAGPTFAQDIKVGLVAPFSGPFAEYGKQMHAGIKAYQKQHGDSVAGRKIVFVVRDTTGPVPELAKRFSQELVTREKVDFLAGYGFTPEALAAAPVAEQAKIPMVVMNAAGTTAVAKSAYSVRFSNTLPQVAAPMGRWAKQNGIGNVVTLVADFTPGIEAETSFKESFSKAGGQVVESMRVPLDSKDLTPYIQRIKDRKPQAVFMWLPAGDMTISIIKRFRERGLAEAGIKLIATGDLTDDHLLPAMGEEAVGLVTTYHYSMAHDSPENIAFKKAFKEANLESGRPNFMTIAAYDGTAAIYEVVRRLNGKIEGDKAMGVLKNIKLTSPRGPIQIDPATRDVVQTVYVRRVERVNGQLENVEFSKFNNINAKGE